MKVLAQQAYNVDYNVGYKKNDREIYLKASELFGQFY